MEEINLSQLVVYQKEEELRKTKSKKKVSLRPTPLSISFCPRKYTQSLGLPSRLCLEFVHLIGKRFDKTSFFFYGS